ncbi:BZ3500_MvSof-1268-A1-R1_Chr9g10632 [Microbotryum saponariae]|uniref:BZ3500_MvSof-1268-A1-R1_Chr9g10632 protein n=1 Tax=Microbotryum saponariae TaxID=289078 RepID=A0A2X0KBZ2_9BASI|nr:BZ3501_MvSof-1269-A2-R1_Chr9g10380 [Microbotryum saponariae]SDA00421.1 BZ3500_MvSof-1268-A1-R1_Chr9g10632 [Microbotryum saponariae]
MHGNCQRCRQPLTPSSLDDSLAALSPSTYDLLSQSERHPHPAHLPDPGPSLTRLRPGLRPLYDAAVAARPPRTNPSTSTTPTSAATRWRSTDAHHTLRIPSPYQPPSGSSSVPPGADPPLDFGPGESYIVLEPAHAAPHHVPTVESSLAVLPPSKPRTEIIQTTSNAHASPSSDPPPLTPRISQLSRLYSLLSAESKIDHPLCVECMDQLLSLINKELSELKKEKDRLEAFEKDVQRRRNEDVLGPTGTKEALTKEIARRKRAAQEALQSLKQVEAERAALDQEKALLDAEEEQLALEEQEFWRDHSNQTLQTQAMQDKIDSVQTRYEHDLRELIKLEKTNVFNDAFCIGQEAGFGTINGLRLGRLPNHPVDWPEINAAWGHTLLLLQTIARKFSYTFHTYKLVPIGSFSRIEKLNETDSHHPASTSGTSSASSTSSTSTSTSLELHGSGDFFAVTRLLQNRRFDLAMVAFLDCLRQMYEYVNSIDPQFNVPHRVVRDKIGDVSIKLQFGNDETWTRALRHVGRILPDHQLRILSRRVLISVYSQVLLDLKILLGRASM